MCISITLIAVLSLQSSPTTQESVSTLRVIRLTDGGAVIRFGNGNLQTIHVDDVVGDTKAVVKEVAKDRLVLEETSIDRFRKPIRALIIIKEGERGGTRYLDRPDAPTPIDSKPVPPTSPSPYGAKPSPKKPPPR